MHDATLTKRATVPPPPAHTEPQETRSARRSAIQDALLLTALALVVRLVYLDHTGQTDELNHVLAARALLHDGTFVLVEGGAPYTRAWIFTYLTAAMFAVLGESLLVARILPMLAGTALVTALFVWTERVAGRTAAWTAGLLLCLSPVAIYLSQFARFYTLHALAVFIAAIAVYRISSPPRLRLREGAVLALLVLFCLLVAFNLQISTAVGVAGVALWGAIAAVPLFVRHYRAQPRASSWILAGAATSVAVVLLAAVRTELLADVIRHASLVDLWAEDSRDNYRFYHWLLLEQYPTLWTLFPVVVLLAMRRSLRAALFCLCVFGTTLVVQSIAAWKAERYIFFAVPFFFALCGMAASVALPALRDAAAALWDGVPGVRLRPGYRKLAGGGAAAVALLFLIAGNSAFSYTYHMLTKADHEWRAERRYRGEPDWAAAAERLRPLAERADIVLASSDVEPLYYLDRVDMLLRPVRTSRGLAPEFAAAKKLGRPAISTPESLRRVMECNPRGLVTIERKRWRTNYAVLPATADYLEAHAERVPLPEEWRMMAFQWRGVPGRALPTDCAEARVQ